MTWGFMTIVEIEYYKGDVFLYGKNISETKLKWQISEIEKSYDRDEDNFVELLCRRFGWTVIETDDVPDFTYDRDVEMLNKSR